MGGRPGNFSEAGASWSVLRKGSDRWGVYSRAESNLVTSTKLLFTPISQEWWIHWERMCIRVCLFWWYSDRIRVVLRQVACPGEFFIVFQNCFFLPFFFLFVFKLFWVMVFIPSSNAFYNQDNLDHYKRRMGLVWQMYQTEVGTLFCVREGREGDSVNVLPLWSVSEWVEWGVFSTFPFCLCVIFTFLSGWCMALMKGNQQQQKLINQKALQKNIFWNFSGLRVPCFQVSNSFKANYVCSAASATLAVFSTVWRI